MKKHTALYFKFFGYRPGDWIGCEVPDCGNEATDIHHIDARGMGGTKKPEDIMNLMALCRPCHEKYGDKKDLKPWLRETHRLHIFGVNGGAQGPDGQ